MGCSQSSPAPSAAKQTVLCLAGDETSAAVQAVCCSAGLDFVRVLTTEAARTRLRQTPVDLFAVVAALGVHPGVDAIFDGLNRSSLIQEARSLGLYCCIYSHTAVANADIADACRDTGAHAVVASTDELVEALAGIKPERRGHNARGIQALNVLPEARARRYSQDLDSDAGLLRQLSRQLSVELEGTAAGEDDGWPVCTDWEEYAPAKRWLARASQMSRGKRASEGRGVLVGVEGWASGLVPMLCDACGSTPDQILLPNNPNKVRCVTVSDTHNNHRLLDLPDGDLLFHCGDIVGNYGTKDDGYDIQEHFSDFCGWLTEMASRYKHVIFIAGNHDTLLDHEVREYRAAHRVESLMKLSKLPPNVHYLNGTDIQVLGLKIFGAPYNISRVETMNARYFSDAFERTEQFRARAWASIPEELDVLMTHTPPRLEDKGGRPVAARHMGDHVLQDRLGELRAPPRFHLFGHDHDYPGIRYDGRTCYVNAAQEGIFRMDPEGGGCAWLFDVTPA